MATARTAHQDRPAPNASAGAAPRSLTVTRFGEEEPIEVESAQVVEFAQGLVGMPDLCRFVVLEDSRVEPCRWLQALDGDAPAFLIVNPDLIKPDYSAEISDEEARQLQLNDAADADVWVIVTIRPNPNDSTVNLLAPVIVNRSKGIGKQIVLDDSKYAVRHPLAPAGS